jgi:hypothetical protein
LENRVRNDTVHNTVLVAIAMDIDKDVILLLEWVYEEVLGEFDRGPISFLSRISYGDI